MNDLTPQQIDILFLTHLHIDHLANLKMFPNAIIYCKFCQTYPGQTHNPQEGTIERIELKEHIKIMKDISIIELPGHTSDLLSL